MQVNKKDNIDSNLMLNLQRVHEDFRLVLVAEDKDVYSRFPIPLINRLEKHFLGKNKQSLSFH